MTYLTKLMALLLMALVAAPVAAQELEVYPLNYRNAEEIIPLLRPHLSQGASLSGDGQRLIVRAEAAERERLRELLEELDRPLQGVRISVRTERSVREGGAPAQRFGTRRSDDGDGTMSVRGVLDRPVHIAREVVIPVTEIEFSSGREGMSYSQRQQELRAENGFYARVRPSGERLLVELSVDAGQAPDTQRPYQRQRVVTQVQGRWGEWLLIGGGAGAASGDDDRIVYRTSSRGMDTSQIWIRVDRD